MVAVAGIGLSPLARTFLIAHVGMAVIMVGTGYVYPILLGNMKERGAGRIPLTRVAKTIARGFTMPFLVIQPLTGLGLILTTPNLWNPFHATNRWLFAAIVLFVAIFLLDTFLSAPLIRRMAALAESGAFDDPEFDKHLTKLSKFGPLIGLLFIAIVILMVWKPGSGVVHF
jgi:hypothetical protein